MGGGAEHLATSGVAEARTRLAFTLNSSHARKLLLGSQCKFGGASGVWPHRTGTLHLLSRNETEIAALCNSALQRHLEIYDLD